MRKSLIIIGYFFFFWLIIPGVILFFSLILDNVIFNKDKLPEIFLIPGYILATAGFILLLKTVFQFKNLSGEFPVSHTPPGRIIRKGVFGIWRHPVYLFASVTLLGSSLIIRSYSLLVLLFPLFMILVYIYVLREESLLLKRFGKEYLYHRNIVPLVIPNVHQWLKIPEYFFFKFFFRLKIQNRENIPDTLPFIIVSGHRHYFDPLIVSYAVNYPLIHISTFEMFRGTLKRRLFSLFQVIPRRRFLKDIPGTRKIIEALKKGYPLCMFPEGGRSWTGELRPLKPESLKLLRHLKNVPIVPVRIEGNYHSWPRWADHLMRSDITISFEKPVWIGNEVDMEKLGNKLLKMISPDHEKERKINCKSKNRIFHLSKVIYRCPMCFSNHLPIEIPPDKLRCGQCGTELLLRPDFMIEYNNNGLYISESIHSLYNKIKINNNDIDNPFQEQLPEVGNKSLNHDEKLIYSASCQLWTEKNTVFKKFIKGLCILGDKTLTISGVENRIVLPLVEIGAATIESNYKLQIYNEKSGILYQLTFDNDSALKWQDILEVFLRSRNNKMIIMR